MTTRLLSLCCALTLLLALPARADELRLKNGDRITGTAASLAGGTLLFKAPGGDLKIAWADVASLTVTQPMIVTLTGTAAPVTATFAPGAEGTVILVPGGPQLLANIVGLAPPQPAWI